MPFATLTSTTLHYTLLSPPSPTNTILFLHGLGSSQNYYYPLLPHLPYSTRCILPDIPGSGRSKLPTYIPTSVFSVNDIAAVMIQLLEFLGIDGNIDIVGHSMGCFIALHLAQMLRGKIEVDRVVLLGPVYPSVEVQETFKKRMAIVKAQGMEAMANSIPSSAVGPRASFLTKAFIRELLLAQKPDGYTDLCNTVAHATYGRLEAVECEVLIVAGEVDKSASLEGCKALQKDLQSISGVDAELEVIEGMGHWHVLEEPERVGELVGDFLDIEED